MIIRSTSKHPREEVERLLQFAATHSKADMSAVCVNVRNGNCAYAGRSYASVPRISNAPPETKYLVTLRIGPSWRFPKTNMVKTYNWKRCSYSEYIRRARGGVWRENRKIEHGKTARWMEKRIATEHPYGGKRSPLIEMQDWQEGFIALAAHEFHHINQFQNNLPRSEVECEKAALATLTLYRRKLLQKLTEYLEAQSRNDIV
jgi:hypothetical protein